MYTLRELSMGEFGHPKDWNVKTCFDGPRAAVGKWMWNSTVSPITTEKWPNVSAKTTDSVTTCHLYLPVQAKQLGVNLYNL